jgi:hypothetical protein
MINQRKKYNYIFCIYSSCADIDLAKSLKIDIESRLETYNSKVLIFLSRDCKNHTEDIVCLDCCEGYGRLSSKTYKMLEYVYSNYLFNEVYKIDATIEIDKSSTRGFRIEETKQEIFKTFLDFANQKLKYQKMEELTRFVGCQQYYGVSTRECGKQGLIYWAKEKSLKVNSYMWSDIIGQKTVRYFSGKFYVLGSDFVKYIIEKSDIKHLSKQLSENLGGSEDLMIGLLHENYLKNKK